LRPASYLVTSEYLWLGWLYLWEYGDLNLEFLIF
jgi:hypothetical protein